MTFYPVFLDLSGKQIIVVGGGEVAERKVQGLLETNGVVKIISPHLTPALRKLYQSGKVTVVERPFEAGDLSGADLVISATDDPEVQRAVWDESQKVGAFVNTVDEPAMCSVIMPAVFRQGDLTVAISTGGKSPALAARIRERMSGLMGPEYGRLLDILGRLRPEIRRRFSDADNRKTLHYRIIDSDVLRLLQSGDETAAKNRIDEIMDQWTREKAPGE
jgi:siroheme synthase-like protein